ncbi:hypothetical protein IAD21_01758 [Abditibacteriota bacterium]|nr:hypothetical protein IAD21_01758 [Abditibacteriota bacterium]
MRLTTTSFLVFAGSLLVVSLAHADPAPPIPISPTLGVGDTPPTVGTADVHLSQSEATQSPTWARFASGKGTGLFVASGVLLPLAEDGSDRNQHALRAADSLLTSTLVTEALKRVIHEKRPDGSDDQSFPSRHASAAFAVASMQAHFHPNQAIFWYLGATAISVSRIKLRRHHVRDVVAGAAIGIATTQIEVRQRRGLLLFPFIHGSSNSNQRVAGLSLGGAF